MNRRSIAVLLGVLLVLAVLAPAFAEDVDGKALYDKKCALCHGKDGVAKSMAEGSGNFNDPEWQKANSVEAIVTATAEGVADTKMKGYADKLSEAEIKAIADYIKTLK